MRISVVVKTNARERLVEKIDEDNYRVAVTVSPEKGKANDAVEKALAAYFGVARSRVAISRGHTAKQKIVDIANAN